MKKMNKTDKEILELCREKSYSNNELARKLKKSKSYISERVDELSRKGKINRLTRGEGRKNSIRTIRRIILDKLSYEILEKIKKKGGKISFKDYQSLLGENLLHDKKGREKWEALDLVALSDLVEKKYVLTKEGRKALIKHKIKRKR
jgi:DNA-binding Lrp family transcriptional regulator